MGALLSSRRCFEQSNLKNSLSQRLRVSPRVSHGTRYRDTTSTLEAERHERLKVSRPCRGRKCDLAPASCLHPHLLILPRPRRNKAVMSRHLPTSAFLRQHRGVYLHPPRLAKTMRARRRSTIPLRAPRKAVRRLGAHQWCRT